MTIDLTKLFASEEDIDPKSKQALIKAIKSNALKDFDYLKFKQSLKTLQEMGMDQETSIKSAFATASTMGLTKSKLLQTAKFYNTILNKEKSKFAEALQNQMDVKVSKKRENTAKLGDKIKEYELKIEKMQNEISLYKQKMENVDEEINAAKEKLEGTKNSFINAYNSVSSIIREDISLITDLL